MVLGQKFFLAKLVKKWLKYGKKLFSRPKKGPNSGFWPKIFWLNWSKNGRNMVNNCFLGLKRVQIVVFGVEKCFGQIGQKMAKIWLKDPFLVNCPLNIDF